MKASSDKILPMFSAALEMEAQGKSFYRKAHAECTYASGKEIFKHLMEDEDNHAAKIKALHKAISAGGGWTLARDKNTHAEKDVVRIFRKLAKRHGKAITATAGDIEALDTGLELERQSIEFYGNHLKKATDPAEREFLGAMVAEEKTHHTVLEDMKFYLTDPASWLLERERSGLDGG